MATLRELSFLASAEDAERWSDALLEAGALSVQAEDADADSPDEQAIYGEPGMPVARAGWHRTRLTALLEAEQLPEDLLAAAAQACGLTPPRDFTLRAVEDQDWVSASQAQFAPIPIGDRLLITPSWHLNALADDPQTAASARITIVLDPGLAFGTGSHPTTHLCLQWLSRELQPGQTVIDYGCGSGILAIAAARLGAGRTIGVDIDPQAVQSALANARNNAVDIEARLTTEAAPEPADVVVANILSNPLKVLAPMLTALVRPGGRLVLAGLLDRQVDEVASTYPQVALSAWASLDGWTCLAGVRR